MGTHRVYRERKYTFGQRLLTLRMRTGLTQTELARQTSVHRRSVQNWETGDSYPRADALQRLIAVFLNRGALTEGREPEEAYAFWSLAEQDAPHRIAPFDEVWFASLQNTETRRHGDTETRDRDDDAPIDTSIVSASLPVSQFPSPSIMEKDEAFFKEIGTPFHHQADAVQRANSLPFQSTSFVGRDAELVEVARILGDPTCRLLTLLGPGGIGKTRLAIEIAAEHARRFADGVAFVPLASVGDADQIVAAICNALSPTLAGQPDLSVQLLRYLRERQILLVLDNFEHLLDGVDLVSAILAAAPNVTILTTSRIRLNLQAEWLFDLEGLAYPSLDQQVMQHYIVDVTTYSAVQLFIQRASQVQPQLGLPEATLVKIVQICQQVAGMPLAIELAAASVRSLSISEIERRIRTNMDALATTFRDVPARHRSIRAVFDHSWNLLSAAERELFARLAVFRGGWTAEAARQVVGATRLTLLELVDKSLVRLGAEPTSAAIEQRYTMLEVLREYALEQLALSPDAESIRRRHAHYFMELAETATAQWSTPQLSAWLQQLYREYENMRAALQWARDIGDSAVGLRLAGALWKFWQGYGYTSEGRAWLDQMLTLDEPNPNPITMVARLCGLQAAAWLASEQHDDVQATRLLEQSMLLRRTLRATTGDTIPLVNTARQERTEGRYQQATAALETALERHRELRAMIRQGRAEVGLSIYDLGTTMRVMGLVYREQGELDRAIAIFEENLLMQRAFGDREGLAFTLIGLADVARDRGDAAGVRKYGVESLAIVRDLRIQWAIGFALNTLARGVLVDGDYGQAQALMDECVTLFRQLNAYSSLAEVLITQGYIRQAQGDSASAADAMAEALRLGVAVGPRVMVAAALEGLASVMASQGQPLRTVQFLAAASSLRTQMGTPTRPVDQPMIEAAHTTARAALGDDAFAVAWSAAQSLTPEQILSGLPGAAASPALADQVGR